MSITFNSKYLIEYSKNNIGDLESIKFERKYSYLIILNANTDI